MNKVKYDYLHAGEMRVTLPHNLGSPPLATRLRGEGEAAAPLVNQQYDFSEVRQRPLKKVQWTFDSEAENIKRGVAR